MNSWQPGSFGFQKLGDASSSELKASRVRDLNDQFRTTLSGGRVVMTSGIAALDKKLIQRIVSAVSSFIAFDTDNDPYHEHDFGALQIDDHKAFFKIDCYDTNLEYGSPDPSDTSVTARVLTIMLAEEY